MVKTNKNQNKTRRLVNHSCIKKHKCAQAGSVIDIGSPQFRLTKSTLPACVKLFSKMPS